MATLPNNTGATNISPQSGTTSGVSSYIPDILAIAQEACEMAGVDFTSGNSLRSAKRSLDLLSMDWANQGLNLWTLDFVVLPLVAGVDAYALPADTIDVVYPVLRVINAGKQQDIPVSRDDFAAYMAIPNKQFQGRPVVFYVHRLAVPVLHSWPVPDSIITYSLAYYRLRRMQSTGASYNLMDVPFRFIPSLVKGLAWQMALKAPKNQRDLNLIAMLKADYLEAFDAAKSEDRDRSSVYLTPYSPR